MKYICSFLFFTLLFILASSTQTFGQTPLKKTNLKAKDRMAWYKELQWEELYMLHPFADEADNDDADEDQRERLVLAEEMEHTLAGAKRRDPTRAAKIRSNAIRPMAPIANPPIRRACRIAATC